MSIDVLRLNRVELHVPIVGYVSYSSIFGKECVADQGCEDDMLNTIREPAIVRCSHCGAGTENFREYLK